MRSWKWRKLLLPVVVVLLALMLISNAFAQEPLPTPSDDEVNAIAKNMYCPVCENVPLDVCPTLACEQWREEIREKLALGWDEEQIQDYFVEHYGDRVLAAPPLSGLNWLVYIVPPVALLAAGYLLFRGLQTWRKPVSDLADEGAEAPAKGDEYLQRMEEELKKRN